MEITLIIQGILIALLVWRVIHLGNLVEKMLTWQDNVVAFQSAQVYLNGTPNPEAFIGCKVEAEELTVWHKHLPWVT